ncbi:TIR domain-containing protein [Streptomyces sp. TLI_55]|uniref:TIR-like protein FxsC n=1 Tax=Streptomyces sp. TLI_55 TaxID=1938861 RepID=UPI000BD07C7C|nr:TIR-like protein FxsC [Streptomyces sp. TLI_55]SNX64628.1 TIR domain-containing protein [Streptomyces sp. TLI_55]
MPDHQPRASVQEPYGFLSYGRNPESPESHEPPDELLVRFHGKLSRHLRQLTDLRAGIDAVYLDQRIPVGTGWKAELKDRLARCQVLVPVLSKRLFASKWCALEWECFERRQQLQRDRGTFTRNAIVPVLWAPLRSDEIPPPYADVQYVHQDFKSDYGRYGLLGLYSHGRHQTANGIAFQLAQEIADVAVSSRLEPCDPALFDDLFDSMDGSAGEEPDA